KKAQEEFEYRQNIQKTEKLMIYMLSILVFFVAVMTVISFYFLNKFNKLRSVLLIEKAKNISADQFGEMQKKYMREQIVSRRKGALLDTIPEGIFSFDQSERITFVNRRFLDWFHVQENVIGDDANKIFSAMKVSKNAGKFIFEGNVFVLSSFENSGETFNIVRNVTDSEELSRKLLDSERLVSIGEMASRITHEIRNPLSTIKLNSEYLAENVDELESSQISGSINLIVKEVERLEQITGKYMNMVKYRNTEETEKNTSLPVDLAEVISFHAAEFEKRKIEVKLSDCENIVIPMTLSSFKEVMLNLFKNGWEELENGGKISVNISTLNGKAVVIVEDSGKGIPENEREQVFRNFYTKKPGGTGIGLSHSRKLAIEAGGRLYAADSTLGGVAMILEIPLKAK
ncbi:MAG TPA: ATP-binding protein, partial [bacterium]|nr:ATP-binding protein [bacterium]